MVAEGQTEAARGGKGPGAAAKGPAAGEADADVDVDAGAGVSAGAAERQGNKRAAEAAAASPEVHGAAPGGGGGGGSVGMRPLGCACVPGRPPPSLALFVSLYSVCVQFKKVHESPMRDVRCTRQKCFFCLAAENGQHK